MSDAGTTQETWAIALDQRAATLARLLESHPALHLLAEAVFLDRLFAESAVDLATRMDANGKTDLTEFLSYRPAPQVLPLDEKTRPVGPGLRRAMQRPYARSGGLLLLAPFQGPDSAREEKLKKRVSHVAAPAPLSENTSKVCLVQ